MIEAKIPSTVATTLRSRSRPGLDLHLQATLDAFDRPVAVLEGSGRILGVNAAWREAAYRDGHELTCCQPGDNYLEVCEAAAPEVSGAAVLRKGLARVLAGQQSSFERSCRRVLDGVTSDLRVGVRRIGRGDPARFLVVQEDITQLVEAQEYAREVSDRVFEAQSEERERLAEELHDSVGQNLVCLGLGISRLRMAAPDNPELAAILTDMAESLRDAHAQVRTVSYLLQPPWPEEHGALEDAVRELAQGFGRRAGLGIETVVEGPPCRLDQARELTLFRVLQEALVNVHRHARARSVTVALVNRGHEVTLAISDDGAGFSAPEGGLPRLGVGIRSMRARVGHLGGDLRIQSGTTGTTLRVRLPTSSLTSGLRSRTPRIGPRFLPAERAPGRGDVLAGQVEITRTSPEPPDF